MHKLTTTEAFGLAAPRRAAVLCLPGPEGRSDLILTQWFNWLNIKRNPMISYAMETTVSLGLNVQEGSRIFLAFPPRADALRYEQGIRTALTEKEKPLPKDMALTEIPGLPVLVPAGSEAVLCCEIAGSYKYPFKKVRIFNCNLIEAMGEDADALD